MFETTNQQKIKYKPNKTGMFSGIECNNPTFVALFQNRGYPQFMTSLMGNIIISQ